MKTTLFLKQTDKAMQWLAFIIPVVVAAIYANDGYLYAIYFAVGAVQIISCLANKLYLDDSLRSPSRKAYEKTLLVIVVITLLLAGGMFITLAFGAGFYLLLLTLYLGSPFLALWYGFITYVETCYIKKLVNRKMYV
jgi:hypothetical protein